MRNLLTPISALGLISLVLSGCASTKDAVLPQDGPPMKAIYEQHIQEMGAHDPLVVREALGNRPVVDGDGALHGYTREAYNEIDTTFPRVPNPSLVMYVFPHLAGNEQVPVPGYVTTFPMYERVEYALPGEAPSQRLRQ
jgi:conjugative transfer region lipoprotein (TIGR03751 family)